MKPAGIVGAGGYHEHRLRMGAPKRANVGSPRSLANRDFRRLLNSVYLFQVSLVLWVLIDYIKNAFKRHWRTL